MAKRRCNLKEKFDKWCLECEEKLWNWVHERPNDREEISKRAMIVACSPIFIGGLIGTIVMAVITIIKVVI